MTRPPRTHKVIDKRLRGYGKDAIPSYYKVIDKRLRGYGKDAIPSYYKYRKKAEFPITMWNSAFLFVFSKQIVTPIPLQPR